MPEHQPEGAAFVKRLLHTAVLRAEADEAKVARVEALLAGYDAWTGADPFDEFASSPKQRDQLRKALGGGE